MLREQLGLWLAGWVVTRFQKILSRPTKLAGIISFSCGLVSSF